MCMCIRINGLVSRNQQEISVIQSASQLDANCRENAEIYKEVDFLIRERYDRKPSYDVNRLVYKPFWGPAPEIV